MSTDPRPAPVQIIPTLALLSLVCYMARTDISIAAKFMMVDLGLSQVRMGQIFSAFMLGYAIFQVPAGLLGDRLGPRAVLAGAAAAWSVLSALTGAVPLWAGGASLSLLLVVRFLLGAAEAAMYPVAARAVAAWIPLVSRAFANSVLLSGMAVGSAITPPLIAWLMIRFGWRASFYAVAVVVLLTAVTWLRVAPKTATAATEGDGSWWGLLRRRDVVLLSASYFLESYIQYIFLFWFFLYLVDVRGFNIVQGGILTSLPYIIAAVSMPLVGYLSDRLSRRRGRRIGRTGMVVGLFTAAALSLLYGTMAPGSYLAVAGISLSVGLVLATEGPFWATASDIAGTHVGAAGGIMNTAGNFAGVASTALVPVLVATVGWPAVFYTAAALSVLAGLLWLPLHFEAEGEETGTAIMPAGPIASGEVS